MDGWVSAFKSLTYYLYGVVYWLRLGSLRRRKLRAYRKLSLYRGISLSFSSVLCSHGLI